MNDIANKSSILLSIFRRKGGEGQLTKIITDKNRIDYVNQLISLEKNESPLLCFKENELNWLLLTSRRILGEQVGVKFSIPFSELTEVHIALQEEFRDGIVNKEDFTRLVLKYQAENKYIINLEKGCPYWGVYQILHYLAYKNQ